MSGRERIGIGGRFMQEYALANYWISRPPILVRCLPLIPIPSRPLRVYSVIEFKGFIAQTYS